jgi:LysR family glycine cleavage system transcriptional activator
LGITQSAVSRQIIEFEQDRGLTLFKRDHGRLIPTPAGQHLSNEIGRAFQIILSALIALEPRERSGLTLSMLPSVATKWLAPRLDRFMAAHPGFELSITATRALVDFDREPIDAAIRYGVGGWPRVNATLLAHETLVAVCTPSFKDQHQLHAPADLLRVTLLHGDLPETWRHYGHVAGVLDLANRPGPRFADDGALLEAAAQGLGVALGRSHLISHDVACGRLTRLFAIEVKSKYSYWFVWPLDSGPDAARALVLDWLVEEFSMSAPYDGAQDSAI